jgi:hypothetical protein
MQLRMQRARIESALNEAITVLLHLSTPLLPDTIGEVTNRVPSTQTLCISSSCPALFQTRLICLFVFACFYSLRTVLFMSTEENRSFSSRTVTHESPSSRLDTLA